MKVYTNWQELPDNPMRVGDSDYNPVMKTVEDDYEDEADFLIPFKRGISFYKVELSLDDVLRINDAASLMGCTVELLLRQAANDERLLYVALKPHSRTLSAIPSHPKPLKGSFVTKCISFVAMMSPDAALLATIGSAEISQFQAGFEPPLDWHYWMLDVPQKVGVDMVFVPRSQLPADAPAAKEDEDE